jgi:FOG: WD40-like repeat
MNRQLKLVLVIALVAAIAISSLAIYGYMALNPSGSNGSWQWPLQNFATGIVADNNNVYVGDIFGNVAAFSAQSGASVWNSSADTGYFAGGLVQSGDRVYGGGSVASVGCLDKATGILQWSFYGMINTDLWAKRAPDAIIVSDKVVASVDGGVSVHDVDTGAFLWQASRPYAYPPVDFGNLTDLNTWWVAAYPLGGNPFEGNYVYVLSGNFSNPCISKFNFQTRTFAWNSSITLTSFPIVYPEASPGYSSNAVSVIGHYQGEVIIQNINQIVCINDSSGSQL